MSEFLAALTKVSETDLTEIQKEMEELKSRLSLLTEAKRIIEIRLGIVPLKTVAKPKDPSTPRVHWKTLEKQRRLMEAQQSEPTAARGFIDPPTKDFFTPSKKDPPSKKDAPTPEDCSTEAGIAALLKLYHKRVVEHIKANGPIRDEKIGPVLKIPPVSLARVLESKDFIRSPYGIDLAPHVR